MNVPTRKSLPFLFPLLALAAVACDRSGSNPAVNPPNPHPEDSVVVKPPVVSDEQLTREAQGDRAFAVALYDTLRSEKGNLFFSPASARIALGMTYLAARGQTAKDMASALHLDADPEKAAKDEAALLGEWNLAKNDKLRISVANRLWGAKAAEFKPEYLGFVASAYGAPLHQLDFENDSEGARGIINKWVEERTEHKILNLLPPGSVQKDTQLVLTNAIYFKAKWATEFAKSGTREEVFHADGGHDVKAKMMHNDADFPIANVDGATLLSMPYAGGDFSMVFVLPTDVAGLPAIEKKIAEGALDTWSSKFNTLKVNVSLPRFTVTQDRSLRPSLMKMGMQVAFSDSADFSGMGGSNKIDDVIQKAFVQVDEEGTEAAAATGVIMVPTVAYEPRFNFVADHPFVYLLRDKRGNVVFMGRVSDPTA